MKGDTAGQGVVPLRTILRNILNLIDSFEQRYKEGLDSYDQEFQDLKQFSENLKSDPGYLCKEGEKSVNRKKNRYKDILPFDYTRVILGDYGDVPGSDYINANFIKGASGSSAYIACQGPLPHTICEFWRMVVECEVQVIVMACNEQESGKHKCENYWVEEEGVEREFGQVTVWLKKSRQVCPDFLVRTMKIRYPNSKGEPEERSVCQFHYSAWPDHGVPLKVRPLLDMVRLIRDCQTSETLPVLVHCSAGCGRTGTICAIDYVWGLLRLGKLTPDFSLFNLVRDMRRQRIAMVQTKDQYILVHRAVRELFEEQLKIIDSHPYANVDINGLPLDIRKDLEEPVYETVQFVSTVKVDDDEVTSWKRSQLSKPVPPPIPPSKPDVTSAMVTVITKHDKEVENVERLSKEQENCKISKKSNGSPSSINKVVCTPSPSSDSHGEASGSDKDKDVPVEAEMDLQTVEDKPSSKRGSLSKQGSSKSSLLRNPSIIKLKSFFEKSKDSKDDKEKKSMPTLSRAKSDVSSSSRFYANLASTFTSRANRYSPSRTKNSPTSASPPTPKEERREKAPSEKIKSKPALLAKPNISVKRSKSLRIIRPTEEPREHVSLISTNSIGTDIPDSSKLVRASISSSSSSSQPSSSSQSHLEANAIKVNVRQVEMPKLQKPVSKSVKAESMKATTSQDHRRTSSEESNPGQSRTVTEKPFSYSSSKKPEVPSKSHLADIPVAKGIYGTTRIKIGVKDDSHDVMGSHVKMNGKIRQKFGTVNPKILSSPSSGGGTLLTRSQSHVWQPSKTQQQIPVRIFSDENLSQMGTGDSGFDRNRELDEHPRGFDEPDGVKLIRKQSLPIAKLFSHKVKNSPPVTQNYETNGPNNSDADHINKEQPRSLNLTSHSTFLEARKRVPKTNPYANYTPGSDNNSFSDKSNSPLITGKRQEKSSAITQFHFGDNVPLLKNNGNVGNSSESSSNPGTPRNSLPGTPTQSIDVLYSPLSLNYPHTRGQSKSILKGSLSSTPSESDERLDIPRHNVSSSLQSQVPSNITGPQKISSVRIAVGIRERRNSFRQAVWKEDQAPTANSIPVENDKSENIYITTATSVPYFVKSSAMPLHPNVPSSANKYQTPPVTTSVNPVNRTHRDYEPIWPDPASAGNPFKVGPSATAMSVRNTDCHDGITGNKMHHAGSHGPSQSQNKLESQVQERMAEIKVLLAELRAPGKVDESKQRSMNTKEQMLQNASRSKPNDLSQSYSAGDKTLQPTLPSTSTTNLKHHRSLRAPSRPQYQQGFTCFTFRKPSSFESITDQLCAEDLHLSKEKEIPVLQQTATTSRLTSEPARNKPESFQQQAPTKNGHPRLNEYVSLRACRSSSGTRTKMEPAFVMNGGTTSTSSSQHPQQPHHPILSKSDSTPIPPPRSKRMGTHRREQGDYANVIPHGSKPDREWVGKESNGFTSSVGGHNLPHRLQNGSSGLKPVRKDSLSDIEVADNHHHLSNGREFSRLTSTGSIPLTNGNAGQTSPKAIIRALGLFQAKAANVRSRFANWAESKDRPGSKRGNVNVPTNYNSSALTRRHDRSTERGGFVEGHGSLPVAATPSVSIAPGPSTSKHQYL